MRRSTVPGSVYICHLVQGGVFNNCLMSTLDNTHHWHLYSSQYLPLSRATTCNYPATMCVSDLTDHRLYKQLFSTNLGRLLSVKLWLNLITQAFKKKELSVTALSFSSLFIAWHYNPLIPSIICIFPKRLNNTCTCIIYLSQAEVHS